MTEPRPQVILEMFSLWLRHGCADAELQAAVDIVTQRARKGRPKSKIYGPLHCAMFALVGVYGRDRFTAAKQVLSLTSEPVGQRENQARALVRRFDESFKEGESIAATQEFYARAGAGERVFMFCTMWQRSNLPWPQDVKSATDMETELRTLAMASNGSIDLVFGNYVVALDKSIAASTLESGRH